MTERDGDEYNPFPKGADEIPGEVAATGAAVVAMRSGAGVCLSRVPEAFRKDSGVRLGVRTPRLTGYFVYIAGVIEVFGGLMIVLGLYTRVAALLLLLDMAAAMWKYNFNEGIYAVREYELLLVLGLAALAVATTGAGPFSLDHLIYRSNY